MYLFLQQSIIATAVGNVISYCRRFCVFRRSDGDTWLAKSSH